MRKAFDIVYDICKRYRTIYARYRRYETTISTTPSMTFDIEGLSPSISNSVTVTFDIEYLRLGYQHTISGRCKTSISNGHSIPKSKSSISNVTFDIEGPTLDIGVAKIQLLRRRLDRQATVTVPGPGRPGPCSHVAA
jgi:hypothetical protein